MKRAKAGVRTNHRAMSGPSATQSRARRYRRAEGYGMPSILVDGNDVLASYAVSRLPLDEARAGDGPRAIEAMTYRMGAHTTSDDPTKYRVSAEEQSWARRDPIARMRAYLEGRGAAASFFDDLDAAAPAYADEGPVRTNPLGTLRPAPH